tara:strand:- start:233 stop:976 length:744 start_codon:yes stop_codon:yes gene_type:complete
LIFSLLLTGALIFSTVRLLEWPLFGKNNKISGYVTKYVCKFSLVILGLNLSVLGSPMAFKGALVSNHISWLDIFALNSLEKIYFTAKSEVARWPIIGWLAILTGTIFIRRSKSKSKEQVSAIEKRLIIGQRIIFFPEGTSSDGTTVLPFKSTLFESFFEKRVKDFLYVQPVTIFYLPDKNYDPRVYAWFDDMSFVQHFFWILSLRNRGEIRVILHKPLKVGSYRNRKDLAGDCYDRITRGFNQVLME